MGLLQDFKGLHPSLKVSAMSKLIHSLATGCGKHVKWVPSDQEANYTDGRTIVLRLPEAWTKDEDVLAWASSALHEVLAHNRHGREDVITAFRALLNANKDTGRFIKNPSNIKADFDGEIQGMQEFEGYKEILLQDYLVNMLPKFQLRLDQIAEMDGELDMEMTAIFCLMVHDVHCRGLAGLPIIGLIRTDHLPERMQGYIQALEERWTEGYMEYLPSWELLKRTYDILVDVFDWPEDPPPPPPPTQPESGDGEGDKGDEDDESPGKSKGSDEDDSEENGGGEGAKDSEEDCENSPTKSVIKWEDLLRDDHESKTNPKLMEDHKHGTRIDYSGHVHRGAPVSLRIPKEM